MSSDLSPPRAGNETLSVSDAIVEAETSSPTSGAGNELAIAGTPLARELAAHRTRAGLVARQGQENAILVAVKKQMEQLDSKVCLDFKREHAMEAKRREQEFNNNQRKLSAMEAKLSAYETKHHSQVGTMNGLKDAFDSNVRETSNRFSEVNAAKVELSNELRTKHSTMEKDFTEMSQRISNLEVSYKNRIEEVNRKLERLDKLVEEKDFRLLKSLIDGLHSRMTEVEDHGLRSNRENAICLYPHSPSATSSALVATRGNLEAAEHVGGSGGVGHGGGHDGSFANQLMEGRIQDLQNLVEDMKKKQNDLLSKFEEQHVRYESLGRDFEAKRLELQARVKTDMDSVDKRFKEMDGHIKEIHTYRVAHGAQMDRLQTRFDDHKGALEAHGESLRRMQDKGVETAMALMQESEVNPGMTVSASVADYALAVAGLEDMMVKLPAELDATKKKLQMLESDRQVIHQVGSFVQALQGLTPQVIAQDKRLLALEQSCRGEAPQSSAATTSHAAAGEDLESKMRELEERFSKQGEEVQQLQGEMKKIKESEQFEEGSEEDNQMVIEMAHLQKKASTTE